MFDILNIENPDFIKNLDRKQLEQLAKEIREFLIESISTTGGHLASNLGVVELVLGLYKVFDYENDSFLFDVGHQAYVHKILTGRAKEFKNLRKYNGLSGYISRSESKYDIWESGHSSTTISAMAGLLLAQGKDSKKRVISVIGDASIVNGVSLEALNYLGSLKSYAPIIILNDNNMGISKSVGSLSKVFDGLRSKKVNIKLKRFFNNLLPAAISNFGHKIKRGIKGFIQRDNIFEDLGFDYYGPIDGNDMKIILKSLERIKKVDGPVILHVITKKGKGYKFSEEDKLGNFHGVEPFNIETGKALKEAIPNEHSYSEIVSESLLKLRLNKDFIVITPAMKVGAKLEKFASTYPNSFIDVGIAEEHATVMSAGLALGGKKSVLLMYSTFSQRAYDYFLNDVARSDLPIVIGLDRAGVVGGDGSTHEGIYDISMFMGMPNFHILAPMNGKEIISLLDIALDFNHPVVFRYPRANEDIILDDLAVDKNITFNWDYLLKGNKGIVISYGPILNRLKKLILDNNLDLTLVNARIIKPVDMDFVNELKNTNLNILVIEEVIESGNLASQLRKLNLNIKEEISFNVDTILPFGSIKEVLDDYGFSDEDILRKMKKLYEN